MTINRIKLKELRKQRSLGLLTRQEYVYNSRLFKYAKENYMSWTKAEKLMNGWLSNWKFKHSNQVVISPYIVDILLTDLNIVIELDGKQHQNNLEYNTKRSEYLKSLGYRILRFQNKEMEYKQAVQDKLWKFVYEFC